MLRRIRHVHFADKLPLRIILVYAAERRRWVLSAIREWFNNELPLWFLLVDAAERWNRLL